MNTVKPFYTLPLILLAFLATSCRAPKDLVYRDFKNLKVEKLGFGASSLKLDLVYYNPNNFGMQLKYVDLEIFIDNNYLGHSTQDYQITIPRLSEFILPIQIEVAMESLLKNVMFTFLGKEVNVRITGKVKLGKANIYKTFPVIYEGTERLSFF